MESNNAGVVSWSPKSQFWDFYVRFLIARQLDQWTLKSPNLRFAEVPQKKVIHLNLSILSKSSQQFF